MIGAIKILRAERIQDGVERIEFAAGEAAVRAGQERDDLLSGAADVLRVPNEQLPKTAARFFEEWKSQQKEIERLKEDLAKARLKTLTAEAETMDGLKVVVQKMGSADIEELLKAAALLAEQDCVALLGARRESWWPQSASRAWRRASRRGASSRRRPSRWAGAEEASRTWLRAEDPMWKLDEALAAGRGDEGRGVRPLSSDFGHLSP